MDLIEIIENKRPNLSINSLRTYKSILTNLYRNVYPDDEEIHISKYDNEPMIMEHLKDIPYSRRKTTLAALVVLTGNKSYNKMMMSDVKEYSDNQMLQKKDGKFAENMIPTKEVEDILKKLEMEAKNIYKKASFDMNDYQKIQNFILLALTGGIYMPPRRSLDFVMKHKGYDVEKDNYIDLKKKEFIFNMYKTKATHGQAKIEIPKPLLAILKKWISILPENQEYLLFDNKKKPITPPQITHRLNAIFGKKISTSMLRHIYLTNRFGNVNLKDINDTANAMGNSPTMALQYVKK